MNMIKRGTLFISLLLFVMAICSGCSSRGPAADTLQSDLTTYLQSYYSFLSLDDYEIVKSMTQEQYYSATISATAHSEYAVYNLTAYINYCKYDQGWSCNYCEWSIDYYSVTGWPTEDEMSAFLGQRALEVEDYLQYPDYSVLYNDGSAYIAFEGTVDANFAGYVGIKGSITSYWMFDAEKNTFIFSHDDTYVDLTLTHSIEGTWKDERMSGVFGNYYFIITDQGPNYFTIEYTYEGYAETVYLTSDLRYFKENGRLTFENKTSNHKTSVSLYESDDYYVLQYYSNYDGSNYDYNKWAYID